MFVSIETYSMIKTYTLYVGYAGLFSIGYNDGMYLKYGGKALEHIDKKNLADNFVNFILMIFVILLAIMVCGIILNDFIIVAFAFGMFSYNIQGYLRSLYQATGEFKAYGGALNSERIVVFLFIMFLIFAIRSDNYKFYIGTQVLIGVIITIYLLLKLEKKLYFLRFGRFALNEYKSNISDGFILMLGNLSSIVFTGLDRWFVKFLMTSTCFAMYSFAVSVENMVNVLISPITVSMYNYFCKEPSYEEIRRVKSLSVMWGTIVIAAAFPVKWILENWLEKYLPATGIIFILFGAQIFYIVVKGIYVNLYKAHKQQDLYLKQMIVMIVVGIILNVIFYLIWRDMRSFAIATMITAMIWMYVCEWIAFELRFSLKENISIILVMTIYLFAGNFMGSISGGILYCAAVVFIFIVFMRDKVEYVLEQVVNTLRKRKI